MTTNKTPISTFRISNMPEGRALFREIAGNFHRFSEITYEFIDNAISDLRAHPDDDTLFRTIRITLEADGDGVKVGILDGGSGIADLDNALTLAGKTAAQTPMNEHGFGLKHALASACARGAQEWLIQTRTADDACLDRYREVRAPYDTVGMQGAVYPGSGELLNDTGTYIYFRCSRALFATVKPKNRRAPASFAELAALYREDLAYTYASVLENESIKILVIQNENGKETRYDIKPLVPDWQKVNVLHAVPADLGGGSVTLECAYGTISASKDNAVYYKGNMASSGVELRLNGRVIERGLYDRIWGEAIHPSQNRFLARIDLRADDRAALPRTKSAKNGFREDDARLEQLFTWIRTNIPKPEKNTVSTERRLVHALAEKKAKEPGVLRVCEEETAFQSIGLRERMDLYVSYGDKSVVYEAKVKSTRALDLYQLRMYWDGCALDGRPLTEAYLIAKTHPKEVTALLSQLNRQCDPTGVRYCFKLTTWEAEGVALPAAA